MAFYPHVAPFTLFIRSEDASPCQFGMIPGKEFVRISELIDKGGGILEKSRKPYDVTSSHKIILHDKSLKCFRSEVDIFDVAYIEDCVSANELLPNLSDYRLGPSYFEPFDPYDILIGRITWSNLTPSKEAEGVDCSEMDDSETVSEDTRSGHTMHRPYSREEQLSILKYIVENGLFSQLRDLTVWKKMESDKVCRGSRTYKSMHLYFSKQFLPQLQPKNFPEIGENDIRSILRGWDENGEEVTEISSNSGKNRKNSDNSQQRKKSQSTNEKSKRGNDSPPKNSPGKGKEKLQRRENTELKERFRSPRMSSQRLRRSRRSKVGNVSVSLSPESSSRQGAKRRSLSDPNATRLRRRRRTTNRDSEEESGSILRDSNDAPTANTRHQRRKQLYNCFRNEFLVPTVFTPRETSQEFVKGIKSKMTSTQRIPFNGEEDENEDDDDSDNNDEDESSNEALSPSVVSNNEEVWIKNINPNIKTKKSGKHFELLKDWEDEEESEDNTSSTTNKSDPLGGIEDMVAEENKENNSNNNNDNVDDNDDANSVETFYIMDNIDSDLDLNPEVVLIKMSPTKSVPSREKVIVGKPYRPSEDKVILNFVKNNPNLLDKKGLKIFHALVAANLLPGRNAKSMRKRYKKLLEGDEKRKFKRFTRKEDQKIINFIIENNLFANVKGVKIYNLMEEVNLLPLRSSDSMKVRFLKRILPRISSYTVSKNDLMKFKSMI